MKLNEPLKEKKLPFFSWILFHPLAFKVVFIMSMVSGILVCSALLFATWYYSWGSEVAIVVSLFTIANIYTAIKMIKLVRHSGDTTLNDMVYSSKYKPKKGGKNGSSR